jgi:hypothetical protein
MGKALPQKSSAEMSHGVKWAMGEKASCGRQDSRDAAAQTMVGGALSASSTNEAANVFENARVFTRLFV